MTIERDLPGQGKSFKAHAKGKRGVTAWVERPGELDLGDVLRLHCPSNAPGSQRVNSSFHGPKWPFWPR